MADVRRDRDEVSLGQLFTSASQDFSKLLRSEVELAKAELRQDARNAATGAGLFGVAAVLLLLAAVLGSIAAVYGLSALGVTRGWSFLIVMGIYVLLALILALVGARKVKRVRPPERTIRTTKESVAMLKSQARPGGG
jgi:hypothetical protein